MVLVVNCFMIELVGLILFRGIGLFVNLNFINLCSVRKCLFCLLILCVKLWYFLGLFLCMECCKFVIDWGV